MEVGKYLYKLPHWEEWVEVEIEEFDNQKWVRFKDIIIPVPLHNLPPNYQLIKEDKDE